MIRRPVSAGRFSRPHGDFHVVSTDGVGILPRFGEVSEWLKVPLSKSGEVMSLRGFESHPLRRDGLSAATYQLILVLAVVRSSTDS
jgi:hypothetical protein